MGFQQAFWGDNGIKATMTRRTPVSYPYLAGLPSDSQRRDSLDRMVKAVRTSFVERIQKQVPENVIRPPSSGKDGYLPSLDEVFLSQRWLPHSISTAKTKAMDNEPSEKKPKSGKSRNSKRRRGEHWRQRNGETWD